MQKVMVMIERSISMNVDAAIFVELNAPFFF